MPDITVWQRLPELRYTLVGNLRVADVQPVETSQSFQVLQAGVGDLGIAVEV